MRRTFPKDDGSLVAFRVIGDHLDVDQVSEILGIQPTRYQRIGERVSSTSLAVARRGSWSFACEAAFDGYDHAPISLALDKLLSQLEPRQAAVAVLQQMGLEVGFHIGVFAETANETFFRLEPHIVVRMGELGLPLDVVMYGPWGRRPGTGQADARRHFV